MLSRAATIDAEFERISSVGSTETERRGQQPQAPASSTQTRQGGQKQRGGALNRRCKTGEGDEEKEKPRKREAQNTKGKKEDPHTTRTEENIKMKGRGGEGNEKEDGVSFIASRRFYHRLSRRARVCAIRPWWFVHAPFAQGPAGRMHPPSQRRQRPKQRRVRSGRAPVPTIASVA